MKIGVGGCSHSSSDYGQPWHEFMGREYSSEIVKQEEYDEFQKYINKCEKEEHDKYLKWKEDIIKSGIDFSKDELKYNKMI